MRIVETMLVHFIRGQSHLQTTFIQGKVTNTMVKEQRVGESSFQPKFQASLILYEQVSQERSSIKNSHLPKLGLRALFSMLTRDS